MNTQEMFDTAVNGVISQGRFSGTNTGCFYRHPDDGNIKCAVGHLIEDDVWKEAKSQDSNVGADYVSSETIRNLVNDSIGREMTNKENNMLRALQTKHDGCTKLQYQDNSLKGFVEQVKSVAKVYDLTMDNIIEVK